MRARAIKELDAYERRVYTGRSPFWLTRRGSTMKLEVGSEFYIRPAGSKPNTWRVVLEATEAGARAGVTIVYSLDHSDYTKITANSREVSDE